MLSLQLNDHAVRLLGVLGGLGGMTPPGGLAPGLRDKLDRGIERRGETLTWADSVGNIEGAPAFFNDLTAWECSDSSFHLEDHVSLADSPKITENDQRILLLHGITFALELRRLVDALEHRTPVRCITSANETNATFRFHQVRPNESWNTPDLDSYQLEKIAVLDFVPAHP